MATDNPDSKKQYAFEADTIKINDKDYNKMRFLYQNLSLDRELLQLDMELFGKKKWWPEMHAKLNYRNRKLNGNSYERKQSLASRSKQQTENLLAQCTASEICGSSMGSNVSTIQPQMGFERRPKNGKERIGSGADNREISALVRRD